jgi:hypothetical protein
MEIDQDPNWGCGAKEKNMQVNWKYRNIALLCLGCMSMPINLALSWGILSQESEQKAVTAVNVQKGQTGRSRSWRWWLANVEAH